MKDHRWLFKVGEFGHLYVLSYLLSGSLLCTKHKLNKHFIKISVKEISLTQSPQHAEACEAE